MPKKYRYTLFILLALAVLALFTFYVLGLDIAVLNPKGIVAAKEHELFVVGTLLMLIVVVPVFVFIIYFAWKYRASNQKAKYTPEWGDNFVAELIWWGIPCLIIAALGVITWTSSHDLDPYKPLDSSKKPLTIQVVALQWKWLFIYPEQKIATVNFVQFPEQTPINFQITSDAPMNSFWIPQLSGQIFAMPGMKTELHVMADEPGSFRGCSANISGKGFAGMTFIAKASSEEEFEAWVASTKNSPLPLGKEEYQTLALPSENNPVTAYVLKEPLLYDQIVMKYMMPMKESE